MNYQFIKNKLRYVKRFLLGAPTRLEGSAPPVELSFILNYLEAEDTAFDVGANLGVWSYFLSQSELNLNIVAFEPNPNVVKSLVENTSNINNISIERCGVGSVNGKADFHIHPSHGRSSFAYTREYSGCKVMSVPIVTLDSYTQNAKKRDLPALIKVDVEGLEPEVWEGMQLLLLGNRPKVMVFELVDRHLRPRGYSVKSLTKKIVNAGYKCFVYDDDGMVSVNVDEFEFPPEKPKPRKYVNFVFVDITLIKAT